MAAKLEADGWKRRQNVPASFPKSDYGMGYDEKARAIWRLLSVLSTGAVELFTACAIPLLKDMSQADIAMDVVEALGPDESDQVGKDKDQWHACRLGALVVARTWNTGSKGKGRLSAKGHTSNERAQKDFDRKVKKAKAKLAS